MLFGASVNGSGGLSTLDGYAALRMSTVDLGTASPDGARFLSASLCRTIDGAWRCSNGFPFTKIEWFEELLRLPTVGPRVKIASLKFCFTDFDATGVATTAEVDTLWETYRARVAALQADYPGVRFVHVTVPLMRAGDARDNALRERFSSYLRATYPAADVFDLADVQSRDASGASPCAVAGVRCQHESWAGADPRDYGHMNDAGYTNAARAWLTVLACPGR
jgi:hypothetical protein